MSSIRRRWRWVAAALPAAACLVGFGHGAAAPAASPARHTVVAEEYLWPEHTGFGPAGMLEI